MHILFEFAPFPHAVGVVIAFPEYVLLIVIQCYMILTSANRHVTIHHPGLLTGKMSDRNAICIARSAIFTLAFTTNMALVLKGDLPEPYYQLTDKAKGPSTKKHRALLMGWLTLVNLLVHVSFYVRELLFVRRGPRLKLQINDVIILVWVSLGGLLMAAILGYSFLFGSRPMRVNTLVNWTVGVLMPFLVIVLHMPLRARVCKKAARATESVEVAWKRLVKIFKRGRVNPYVVSV